ncbi:MAG: NAD(P)/FAD-dependent oxidoreductase [Ruminococcaceae bacterium]|nr:NAD(P)/FAD-dependent oxidoreductase [Oscillospiraceae bacterium]
MSRVIIIGGGAAGLMAAFAAGKNGSSVTVLERNERPARKVMITGKGRCNVTNDTDVNGLVNAVTESKSGRFLYSAFNGFSVGDTKDFFESLGVPLKTERGNRVFPQSDRSVDIVDALVSAAKSVGAKILTERAVEVTAENGRVSGVKTESGRFFEADSVIIATGGLSYPLTGSTGDGYEMARRLGHTVTELSPSLIPVTVKEGWCSELQGLSLKNVAVKVFKGDSGKPIFSDFGELMFTHYGLSGPVILSASAYMKEPKAIGYRVVIDMKPALEEERLDARLLRDFNANSNRDFINSLSELLPRKMIPVAVKLSKIEPSKKVNQITKAERAGLISVLKNLTLNVTGFRPIEEAVITKGGVVLGEVNPKTMESKLVEGLYFAGEILNADAFTGGFNLQIAFSTGFAAGSNA